MSRTTTKIIIRRENGEVVSQYALGIGEHLIGCESGSGIFIEDDHVSRQHAKLGICAQYEMAAPKDKCSRPYHGRASSWSLNG